MTGSRLTRREVFPFDTPKGEALRKIFETIPIDLDQLDDVVIVNPQGGDGLVYDEDILAWTNAPVGSFKVQPENTVFAGPASGVDDIPSFRALVPGDIPLLSVGSITGLASSRLFGIGEFPTGDYNGVSISVGTGFSFSGNTLNLSTNLQGWSGLDPATRVQSVNTRTGAVSLTDSDVPATVVTESGTSRAMANSDAGQYIRFTSGSAKTATFGTGLDAVGQEFHIRNVGANNLTLTPSSTTLNAPAGGTLVIPPGGTVTVKQVASTEFDVFGTTTAA